MHVEMVVTGLAIDPVNNAPIVILREKDGERIVPIWIGVVEASAIAFELEEVKLARPMTHDLLRGTIEALGGKVERVVVVDLRDNTYFAVVVIAKDGHTIEIDSRPSDAIALALRAGAPVLCDGEVVDRAQARQVKKAASSPAVSKSAQAGEKSAEEDEEVDRGENGPRPIVCTDDVSAEDLLERLRPEDFGKYKM